MKVANLLSVVYHLNIKFTDVRIIIALRTICIWEKFGGRLLLL